jgi:hypothetical protein
MLTLTPTWAAAIVGAEIRMAPSKPRAWRVKRVRLLIMLNPLCVLPFQPGIADCDGGEKAFVFTC